MTTGLLWGRGPVLRSRVRRSPVSRTTWGQDHQPCRSAYFACAKLGRPVFLNGCGDHTPGAKRVNDGPMGREPPRL